MCTHKKHIPLWCRRRSRTRLVPARRGNINVSLALVAMTEGVTDLLGAEGLIGISHIPRAVRRSLYTDRGVSSVAPEPKEPDVFIAGRHMVKAALEDRQRQDAEDVRLYAENNPFAVLNAA